MGKIQIITREQEIILDELKQNEYLTKQFYFTGGTALSAYYLKHRYSEDLDFFSFEKYDNQVIFSLVSEWGKKHKFTFQSRFVEVVYIFNLTFANGKTLKVDFSYYPYKQVETPKEKDGIKIDSLFDIAVNKMLTIDQRTDVKDFTDLYFLRNRYTFWDLMPRVLLKFGTEIDPLLLASDLLKIDDFDVLPRMIKKVSLDEMKKYFRKRAKEIGGKSVV
jgi:predicted nucleotidyltransferase component of viral defense system